MISTSELRIGNFIIEEDGCIAKVIGFSPFDHSVRCDQDEGCEILVDVYRADGTVVFGAQSDSGKSNPIPLTPDVLVKCGFVKLKLEDGLYYEKYLNHKETFLFYDNILSYGILGVSKYEWSACDHIESLHQLMNLYYMLTNTELKYQP